jgi:hypothetical protein
MIEVVNLEALLCKPVAKIKVNGNKGLVHLRRPSPAPEKVLVAPPRSFVAPGKESPGLRPRADALGGERRQTDAA